MLCLVLHEYHVIGFFVSKKGKEKWGEEEKREQKAAGKKGMGERTEERTTKSSSKTTTGKKSTLHNVTSTKLVISLYRVLQWSRLVTNI